ncbi:glycine zipper 2TM domain-containing protein [Sphingomonas sp. CARO-RG-8B-R24-01]|uniref:glycine zipper 2TM domain-containing protein n=1 Tax=Sphingomonas sp. CARO-RG-8B-R24-01 TaxID=2914831 RepID=UPI001F59DC6C|nr:glycine zipper 2TM domain-containing protein [Sphingomonas sp. CARO-RG-8B-R24-01]
MFKTLMLAATAMAVTASGLAATPASAQRYDRGDGYAYDQAYRDGYNRDDGYRGGYRGGYRDDRRGYDDRGYNDRRYYNTARNGCRSGDSGTIIGAIAGGLLGNVVAGRGDRTLGTVLGAGGGALAGRAIDRDGRPGYCR